MYLIYGYNSDEFSNRLFYSNLQMRVLQYLNRDATINLII